MDTDNNSVVRTNSSMGKNYASQVTPPQSPRQGYEVRPKENVTEELNYPPPSLIFVPPIQVIGQPGAKRLLFPTQEQSTGSPNYAQLADIVRANQEEGRRNNAEMRDMFQQIGPGLLAIIEENRRLGYAVETANVQLNNQSREARQFQRSMEEKVNELERQLQQQGVNVGQQLTNVGQQLTTVGEDVKTVGTDVNLGRQENVTNFGKVRQDIDDFKNLAIKNFDELKKLVKTAGKNAVDGCLPLEMSSITEFVNSFLKCLYYFGVFIIYVFGIVAKSYMYLRQKIFEVFKLVFGLQNIIDVGVAFNIIWGFFETLVTITIINTVGVWFGYEEVGFYVCQQAYNLFSTAVILGFQVIWSILIHNPFAQTLFRILEEVGFFTFYNWVMTSLENFKVVWLYLVATARNAKAFGDLGKGWLFGGDGQLILSPRIEAIDIITTQHLTPLLNNYSNSINQMMDYMHSILTGTKDPNLYKYFDTQQSRELANTIQRRISLIENLLITGNVKMLSNDGPTIEEISGGKTRRRRFKKSASRKSVSKKKKKTKQLRRRKYKKGFKSKKSKKY